MLQVKRCKWKIMLLFTGLQGIWGDLYPTRLMFMIQVQGFILGLQHLLCLLGVIFELFVCDAADHGTWSVVVLRKISCVVHSRDTEKTDEKPLLWHQTTAVHSAIFKSLYDPTCVAIKQRSHALTCGGQAAKSDVSKVRYSLSLF